MVFLLLLLWVFSTLIKTDICGVGSQLINNFMMRLGWCNAHPIYVFMYLCYGVLVLLLPLAGY